MDYIDETERMIDVFMNAVYRILPAALILLIAVQVYLAWRG